IGPVSQPTRRPADCRRAGRRGNPPLIDPATRHPWGQHMATIEELEKEISERSKQFKNLLLAVNKQQEKVDELKKELKKLKESGADKSKDKKVKESYKETDSKLTNEQKTLGTLEETHESAGATLSKLNERRRSLTEYVDARKAFFTWWDKQEAKMSTLVDK